jgi:hypothetical protein
MTRTGMSSILVPAVSPAPGTSIHPLGRQMSPVAWVIAYVVGSAASAGPALEGLHESCTPGATIYFGYEIYISETSILTQKHMSA